MTPSRRLARHGWAVLALAGLCLLLLALALHVSPRQYTATAVVSLTPRQADSPPAASMFTLLTKSYVAFAGSDYTAQRISQATGIPSEEVMRSMSVTLEPNTTNIEVESTMGTPGDAALVAGAAGVRLVAFSNSDRTLEADMVVPPTPPEQPELQDIRTLVVLGLVLAGGVLLASAAVFGIFGGRSGGSRSRRFALDAGRR